MVSVDTTIAWTSELPGKEKVAEVFNFELGTQAFSSFSQVDFFFF